MTGVLVTGAAGVGKYALRFPLASVCQTTLVLPPGAAGVVFE